MNKPLFLTLPLSLAALGCSSGPSRIEPPSIDAGDAASQAMEMHDKDSDGFIAGGELDAIPAIKGAMETVDADGDGKVSAEEITKRIETWQAGRIGLATFTATFTLDGQPLSGASVTFDPEPFLGDDIKPAVGVTSSRGMVRPSIPKENRVPADAPEGAQIGFYRVRVSKPVNGSESIPAKYNTESTLGQQIAADDPAMSSREMRFELKSK